MNVVCGIAGFIDGRKVSPPEGLRALAAAMAETLRHRGPDDGDAWADSETGVALGHRRLSIIDLSPFGRQPMTSASGRFVIVFNGEVFNFRALRKDLEAAGARFRGNSDTEVMLGAIEAWGLDTAVTRFVGMFAFALWDREERTLSLVRDRLGIKPLYYADAGGVFLFGSELKALRAHASFPGEIDRSALALFMRHNYIPSPYTIYRGVRKLPAGAMLAVRAREGAFEIREKRYWTLRAAAEAGIARPFTGTDREAADELERLLRESVRLRLESDVPLGCFLSGGIDSSTVAALMRAGTGGAVRTFTVGFAESAYSEAAQAREVAQHLGADHTEIIVTPREAMDVIPRLPRMYDEPFADSSQIPTALISAMARRHVTVCLSGDGGDECFGGYERYRWARTLWRSVGWLPAPVRRGISRVIRGPSPAAWDRIYSAAEPGLPRVIRRRLFGDKLHKLAGLLGAGSPDDVYFRLLSHWKRPADVVIGGVEPPTVVTDRAAWPSLPDFPRRMMYLDGAAYLPDDILVKVDRASMAAGLETRVPFLDHRVVEFAWRLPPDMKIRRGRAKWILREVLYRHVPRKLVDRPKMGFGVPLAEWLRGPLRGWAEGLIGEERLRREGFFHPDPIRRLWADHLSGRRNGHYLLWDVLMFQAWLEAVGGRGGGA
ncbi:MAG: asparagine synthase (glutamine-hydrolyzing) [Planctomycetota bacterium]